MCVRTCMRVRVCAPDLFDTYFFLCGFFFIFYFYHFRIYL